MTNSYIALDLETTGLDPKKDKIIEIGALKIVDGQITDRLQFLVNPRRQMEERVVSLTGITDEMVAGESGIEDRIGQVLEFCGDLPLLGHHIIFDYSFLKRAAVNHRLMFEKNGIDTLRLCRLFMPENEKKNLESALRYFQISGSGFHRAMADAEGVHHLYQTLLERFGSEKPKAFSAQPLIYKVKREQPATKRQKEHLQELLKYHKIHVTVQTEYMTRNEISRLTDQIISQYGRI
ncbi:MAG: PolC-type DNA polymerase III [Lachnospiraceae bacterium]